MRWYRDGTVTVTQGSTTLTGVGTLFHTIEPQPGDLFTIDGSLFYEVLAVVSDTEITLATPYAEATAVDTAYAIIRTFAATTNQQLAAKLYQLLHRWDKREQDMLRWLSGAAGGGTNSDGRYPIRNRAGQVFSVKSPQQIEAEFAAADVGGLIYRGDFEEGPNYDRHNIVSHGGAVWIATQANNTVPTEANTNWRLLFSSDAVNQEIAGYRWYFLAGVPDPNLGVNGNLAMNTLTADVYRKDNGTWDLEIQIGSTVIGALREVFVADTEPDTGVNAAIWVQTGTSTPTSPRPRVHYRADDGSFELLRPASATPAGVVSAFAGATAPDGWLLCDGAAVSRATYDELFAAIGTLHGVGDGTTTFNVPNLDGMFPMYSTAGTVGDTAGTPGEDTHTHDSHNTSQVGLLGLLTPAHDGPAQHSPYTIPRMLMRPIIKW